MMMRISPTSVSETTNEQVEVSKLISQTHALSSKRCYQGIAVVSKGSASDHTHKRRRTAAPFPSLFQENKNMDAASFSEAAAAVSVLRVPSKECATVEHAVELANAEFQRAAASRRPPSYKTVTILLDPSMTHEVEHTLVVKAIGDHAKLVIASAAAVEDEEDDSESDSSSNSQEENESRQGPERCGNDQQVPLVMETRTANIPLLKVIQGNLSLRNVTLDHCSIMDYLAVAKAHENNNAAILVDRPPRTNSVLQEHQEEEDEAPVQIVSLDNVVLTSYSGKGLVIRNPQCELEQKDCYVTKSNVGW